MIEARRLDGEGTQRADASAEEVSFVQLLKYYECFYKVALWGNITKAADDLHTSQPGVSKMISALEEELGYQLFVRSKKGVALTPEGQIMLETVKQTFSLLDNALHQIEDVRTNNMPEIRLGTGRDLFTGYLIYWLNEFHVLRPDVRFSYKLLTSDQIVQALQNNVIDVGFATQEMPHIGLEQKRLFLLHDCFIVGDRYKDLTENGPVSAYNIVKYPLLSLPKSSMTRINFDRYFKSLGIVSFPFHEIADTTLISSFVQYNWGVGCIVEEFVRNSLEKGLVHKVNVLEKIPERAAVVLWNKNKFSMVNAEFVDFLYKTASTDACKQGEDGVTG